MLEVTPCGPSVAVTRALSLVGRTEPYVLGTGDYLPGKEDLPFTANTFGRGSDCWGFAGAWCYKLTRHRQGFNHGSWSTVSDDINCDSAIEDAEHKRELFEVVTTPRPGDLLVFPSIRDKAHVRLRIGHVGIVVAVPAEWDAAVPQYGLLTVVQCQAAHRPAIAKGPGLAWLMRDHFRGLIDPEWSTRILRVRS